MTSTAVTGSFIKSRMRVKGNDILQCSIEDVSGDFTLPEGAADGYPDLVCQFIDDPASWTPDNGTATLNETCSTLVVSRDRTRFVWYHETRHQECHDSAIAGLSHAPGNSV
jgi:hypothetical protein